MATTKSVHVEVTSAVPLGKFLRGLYSDSDYSTLLSSGAEADLTVTSGTTSNVYVRYSPNPINITYTNSIIGIITVTGSFGTHTVQYAGTTAPSTTTETIDIPDSMGSLQVQFTSATVTNPPTGFTELEVLIDDKVVTLPLTKTILSGETVNVTFRQKVTTTTTTPTPGFLKLYSNNDPTTINVTPEGKTTQTVTLTGTETTNGKQVNILMV